MCRQVAVLSINLSISFTSKKKVHKLYIFCQGFENWINFAKSQKTVEIICVELRNVSLTSSDSRAPASVHLAQIISLSQHHRLANVDTFCCQ